MKKLLALLCAAVMLCAPLAACADGSENSGDDGGGGITVQPKLPRAYASMKILTATISRLNRFLLRCMQFSVTAIVRCSGPRLHM